MENNIQQQLLFIRVRFLEYVQVLSALAFSNTSFEAKALQERPFEGSTRLWGDKGEHAIVLEEPDIFVLDELVGNEAGSCKGPLHADPASNLGTSNVPLQQNEAGQERLRGEPPTLNKSIHELRGGDLWLLVLVIEEDVAAVDGV